MSFSISLNPGRVIIKNKKKIASGLGKGLSVTYTTKKVLEDPRLDEVLRITSSGITLTNSEIKHIAKVITSLENTKKISSYYKQLKKLVVKKGNSHFF